MEIIHLGSQFVLNVHMDPLDTTHLSEIGFTCEFTATNKQILKKEDMYKVDNDNYLAPLDSAVLGEGNLVLKLIADVPCTYFEGGIRKEVSVVNTNLLITP